MTYHARKIIECLGRFQKTSRKADIKVSQIQLEILSNVAEKPLFASSLTVSLYLKRLKAQREAFHEVSDHSRNVLLACMSEFISKAIQVKADVAELKTYPFYSNARARFCCLEKEIYHLKATLAEEFGMRIVTWLLIGVPKWTVFNAM